MADQTDSAGSESASSDTDELVLDDAPIAQTSLFARQLDRPKAELPPADELRQAGRDMKNFPLLCDLFG